MGLTQEQMDEITRKQAEEIKSLNDGLNGLFEIASKGVVSIFESVRKQFKPEDFDKYVDLTNRLIDAEIKHDHIRAEALKQDLKALENKILKDERTV